LSASSSAGGDPPRTPSGARRRDRASDQPGQSKKRRPASKASAICRDTAGVLTEPIESLSIPLLPERHVDLFTLSRNRVTQRRNADQLLVTLPTPSICSSIDTSVGFLGVCHTGDGEHDRGARRAGDEEPSPHIGCSPFDVPRPGLDVHRMVEAPCRCRQRPLFRPGDGPTVSINSSSANTSPTSLWVASHRTEAHFPQHHAHGSPSETTCRIECSECVAVTVNPRDWSHSRRPGRVAESSDRRPIPSPRGRSARHVRSPAGSVTRPHLTTRIRVTKT
jgi:hypothetical protein